MFNPRCAADSFPSSIVSNKVLVQIYLRNSFQKMKTYRSCSNTRCLATSFPNRAIHHALNSTREGRGCRQVVAAKRDNIRSDGSEKTVSTSCSCLHQGVQSRRALLAVLLRKGGEAGNVRAHARRLDKERLRLEWFGGVLQVLGKK